MKRAQVAFLFTLTSLSTASLLMAATSTQTNPYGPATPNFGQVLTFNKFDPALGTLNSVKVVMEVAVSGGSLTVDNDGPDPAVVSVELGATGNVSSVDVTLLDIAFQPVVSNVAASTGNIFNLGPENGDGPNNVDGSAPDGAIHFGGNASSMGMGFINPLFHPGFIGASQTFDINAQIVQILDFGSVGGVEGAFSPVTANGYVQVIYDYTAVIPEPATIGMLMIGLCLMLLRRRTH